MTASPWITVIGIGEDGLSGLAPARVAEIEAAQVLVGGDRHQGLVADFTGERLTWAKSDAGGFRSTFDDIEARRGQRVVVLATGDPLYYGAGAALCDRFGMNDVVIHPAPGAISLAAARMGWSLPDTDTFTLHGRPLETAARYLADGARLIALSENGETPAALAKLLADRGYGASEVTALEHLGGEKEKAVTQVAQAWGDARVADLNTIAVLCVADAGVRGLSRVPGLADDAFAHDGQITKREVRALTLSSLAPLPGETLWDVGAGAGSIAIEWMRAAPHSRAIAIERDPARTDRIAANARTLGVPKLAVIEGAAADVLDRLPGPPDAIFIGGGVTGDMLDACWAQLPEGGRLVANAVTATGEAAVIAFHARHGGAVTRLSVEHLEGMGATDAEAFSPKRAVTHLAVWKGAKA